MAVNTRVGERAGEARLAEGTFGKERERGREKER